MEEAEVAPNVQGARKATVAVQLLYHSQEHYERIAGRLLVHIILCESAHSVCKQLQVGNVYMCPWCMLWFMCKGSISCRQ